MVEKANNAAALANAPTYDAAGSRRYVAGAPHLKHASLRALYATLLKRVFAFAQRHTPVPRVLDLGAGEGTATLSLLKLGATVTAIDVSSSQLELLRVKCAGYEDRLEERCQDVNDALKVTDETYDMIVATSFLHHIPDYLGVVAAAVRLLEPWGQLLSFQDPLRYDRLPWFTATFSKLAYFSWRIFQGDVHGGVKRRLRRSRGIYVEAPLGDNAEYHVIRNGVDAEAIAARLRALDCECEVVRYFSTQSTLFQPVGLYLGLENTFGIVAFKKWVVDDLSGQRIE